MRQYQIVEVLPLFYENMADGASFSVLRLCESLIRCGAEVILANCDCTRVLYPPPFLKRFKLGVGPKKLCRSPLMYQWLKQLARANKVSLIHSQGLWTMPNIYPSIINKQYRVPVMISPLGSLAEIAIKSGSAAKKIFWPLYQHKALQTATCFHATGEAEYNDIRRMGFKQPIAVIPNGVDIPDRLVQKKQQLRTLLFLGRINPIKGLDMLLPSWGAIQNKFPDWQLRIVGPDSKGYLHEVQKIARDLGLQRVEFSGVLTGKPKWQAYQNAELFVLPSYSENFGETIAEALASGIPVITTKGTPWELLGAHNAGWWIDIGKLTQCLEYALGLPASELSAMGQNGKVWMERDFSWHKTGQMMLDTYAWVIDGGHMPDWIRLD